MLKVKVTTVGSSAGVVIPKEAMSRMKLKKGDTIFFTETEDVYEITPYNPSFNEEMNAAEQVMSKYRNALRKLAELCAG